MNTTTEIPKLSADVHTYSIENSPGVFPEPTEKMCWRWVPSKPQFEGQRILVRIYKYRYWKYFKVMVDLLNKLTPVEVEMRKRTPYVYITLLPYYDQNVLLLRYLKYLWHDPVETYFYNESLFDDVYTHNTAFFENLKDYDDAMVSLTNASVAANKAVEEKLCGKTIFNYIKEGIGHSNYFPNAVVKTTKEFLNFNHWGLFGYSTRDFLTCKHKI